MSRGFLLCATVKARMVELLTLDIINAMRYYYTGGDDL